MPGFEVLGKEEQKYINRIIESGFVLSRDGFDDKRNGTYSVAEFEKAMASKLGFRHSYGVTSGTAALKCALKALGIKQGDEVITSSHTFIATAEAIVDCGAVPIFTEVDKSLNMDPNDIENRITSRTKAIIPVHMYGAAADMDKIMKIARKHSLKVLEDSAQGYFAKYKGKPLGSFGDITIISFDPVKIITTGEGGMILTNDEKLFKRSREFADHGHESNPNFPRGEDTRSTIGFNFRMNEMQAAIGLGQLEKADHVLGTIRKNKNKIKKGISSSKKIEFRHFNDDEHVADVLVFYVQNKEQVAEIARILKENKIGTKNLPGAFRWHFAGTWDHFLSDYECYKGIKSKEYWPKTRELLERTIAIPIFVKMNEKDIERHIKVINEAIEKTL